MMTSHHGVEVKGTEKKRIDNEPDLGWMARYPQICFKLGNLHDQMGFNPGQLLYITKSIIELTSSSGGADFAKIYHVEEKV